MQVEWTLDAAGLPMKQYENSDAAAHQWSSLWVRDDSGRTTRIETEMLEGIGDADQTRELRYQEVEGTVVVSYEQYDEVHTLDLRRAWSSHSS